MLSLRGVIHGTADGVSHTRLRPGHSTYAIMGTDVLGSVLPHTLDIKNGLLFTDGGASLQLHRRDTVLSGCVFTVGRCSIPPYSEAVLHCTVRTTSGHLMPSSGLLGVCRKYRPRRRQNSGGSISVEGAGPHVQLQPGYSYGGAVLVGGHGGTGVRHTISNRNHGLASMRRRVSPHVPS